MKPDGLPRDRAIWIGRFQALKATFYGVLIAYGLMSLIGLSEGNWVEALLWPITFDYGLNLTVGVGIFVGWGWVFGGLAGTAVLKQQKHPGWVGVKYGVLTLSLTAAMSGVVGYFQEGLRTVEPNQTPFFDYLVKPAYWIFVFGFIPAALVGLWFGYSIRAAGRKCLQPMPPVE